MRKISRASTTHSVIDTPATSFWSARSACSIALWMAPIPASLLVLAALR